MSSNAKYFIFLPEGYPIGEKIRYTENDSRIGFGKAGARILNQRSGAEAAQLKKLGDAGGFKSRDASAAKTDFSIIFGIYRK